MADIYWDRIEPHTRDAELEEALEARVADPLFLLARQWQVGEFRGEDAASPIRVQLGVEEAEVTTFSNAAREPFHGVLVARVEAHAPAESIGLSGEAGLALLERLDQLGVAGARKILRDARPLKIDEDTLAALPPREQRSLRLIARASIDGARVLREGAGAFLALFPGVDTAPHARAFAAWSKEQEERFVKTGAAQEAWSTPSLEHHFEVSALSSSGELVLRASGYPGGELDWHAFDLSIEPGARAARMPPKIIDVLPVPLAYPGMPASRYWEIEDNSVYFGGIEAGPLDLGRLLIAEMAAIYGDDWSLIPVRLRAGCAARIVAAVVTDTFGEKTPIFSTAALDEKREAPRVWSFFEQSGDPSAANGESPWLFVCPASPAIASGESIEAVSFVRDEAANMVWAVEEKIESPSGTGVARRFAWRPDATRTAEGEWRYRLQSAVPPHWIPFVPERRDPRSPEIELRRARMSAWEELEDVDDAGAKSRLLSSEGPLYLREEEIPARGCRVTRAFRYTRGSDGRSYLWCARRKQSGRGEHGSGLRFDAIERER